MSTRASAGSPAQLLRSLAALATLTGAFALPGAAQAAATDLQVVVSKTATSQPGVPAVVNMRLKNNGSTAYDPAAAGLESDTELRYGIFTEWPPFATSVRSAHGWDCTTSAWGPRGSCHLDHVIPAGGRSLPIEIEAIPTWLGESTSASTAMYIDGDVSVAGTEGGKPTLLAFPVTGAVDPEQPGNVELDFTPEGVADHPRDPKVEGAADRTELEGAEQATVTFAASSGGTISTGPFNDTFDDGPTARFYDGDPSAFPNVKIGVTLPADKVVVDDISFFTLLPERVERENIESSAVAEAGFGELPVESGAVEHNAATGEYLLTLPSGTRLLTDHPVRVVAKVHLRDGVDAAELVTEAAAGSTPLAVGSGRSGRALLPGAASATVKLTRKAPPVVVDPKPDTITPTTPTTPTTPVVPQTPAAATPPPTPDQGAVLGARAAPRLTGRARFAKARIRVGAQTTLSVRIANEGNAASDAGRVCVKLSSSLVVVRLPKGITNRGSVLCAKADGLDPTASALAVRSITVRGVAPSTNATVRDGADDGVALLGDRLQVVGGGSRPGGVTG